MDFSVDVRVQTIEPEKTFHDVVPSKKYCKNNNASILST